jgi:hypothetical protein
MYYDSPMTVTTALGKPRTRPDTPLDKVAQTRLAADELAQIKESASTHGLSVSQYLRAVTLGTATLDPQIQERVITAGSAIPDPHQTAMAYNDLVADEELEIYN